MSKETHSEAFKHIPKNHKEETSVKKISKRHKKNNGIVWEIDLHIERLVENHRNLSNYEIVQIQIRHCEFTIEKAIKNNVSRLVVIHGKGEGVLKEEVRQLLKKYQVAKDADTVIMVLALLKCAFNRRFFLLSRQLLNTNIAFNRIH